MVDKAFPKKTSKAGPSGKSPSALLEWCNSYRPPTNVEWIDATGR
jgi:hypothetical protein